MMHTLVVVLSTLAGGGIGYLIGKFMSRTGLGCPLMCNPKVSTFYFALLGLLIAAK
jgi:hypothetical protein